MPVVANGTIDHDEISDRLVGILEVSLSDSIARCVVSTESRELVRLAQNREGAVKCTHSTVEQYKVLIANIFQKFGSDLPRTKSWRHALIKLDQSFNHHLTSLKTVAARTGWMDYEADKVHLLMAYSWRQCERSSHSRSLTVQSLKEINIKSK